MRSRRHSRRRIISPWKISLPVSLLLAVFLALGIVSTASRPVSIPTPAPAGVVAPSAEKSIVAIGDTSLELKPLPVEPISVRSSTALTPLRGLPSSIGRMNPRHRYIALTLDDGYNFQPALLALLEKYNVRCTTFLIGSWASTHRGEVKSMAAAGLEVANHTWSHSFLTRISPTAMTAQLLRTQKLLLSITGKNVPYLRPPYGDTNPSVKTTAARAGYRLVLWSKTFGDSGRGITAEKAYNNVMRRWGPVVPGDVILCHWGSRESYVALQRIIPELQAKGFTFVTVSELVADSK